MTTEATAGSTQKIGEGLWDSVLGGGWFAADMSWILWLVLAALVFATLSGVGWLTGLPERKRGERTGRSMPSASRMLLSLALFGVLLFVLNHGGIPMWNVAKDNLFILFLTSIPYIGLGYLWAGYQYGMFAEDNKEEVRWIGTRYCRMQDLEPTIVMRDAESGIEFIFPDASHQVYWPQYFAQHASACLKLAGLTADMPKTQFMKNKEQLTMWILFWPTSLVFRFWTDILSKGFDRLLMASRGFFEKRSTEHDVRVSYGATHVASGKPQPSDNASEAN